MKKIDINWDIVLIELTGTALSGYLSSTSKYVGDHKAIAVQCLCYAEECVKLLKEKLDK